MDNARSYRWVGWVAAAAAGVAAAAGAWCVAAGRHDYIGGAVRSPLFVKCGLIAAGSLVALIGLTAVLVRCGRGARQARTVGLAGNDDGAAMVEFALVFPVAMGVLLILIQTMLMMTGAMTVHYAAYAAARSAVVWVPQGLADTGPWVGERENEVADPASSQKCYRIKLAAVVACLPAAGSSTEADPTDGAVKAGIAQYYQNWGGKPPNWVNNYVSQKMGYSWNHTSAQLHAGAQPNVYAQAEDLTVSVAHEFNLAIPVACRIFQDGYVAGVGYTTTIRARCTLNNEGVSDTIQEDSFAGPTGPGPIHPMTP